MTGLSLQRRCAIAAAPMLPTSATTGAGVPTAAASALSAKNASPQPTVSTTLALSDGTANRSQPIRRHRAVRAVGHRERAASKRARRVVHELRQRQIALVQAQLGLGPIQAVVIGADVLDRQVVAVVARVDLRHRRHERALRRGDPVVDRPGRRAARGRSRRPARHRNRRTAAARRRRSARARGSST